MMSGKMNERCRSRNEAGIKINHKEMLQSTN